jgi:hypothetical protein
MEQSMIRFLLEISPVYFKMPKNKNCPLMEMQGVTSVGYQETRGVLLVTTLHGRDRNTTHCRTSLFKHPQHS